MTQNICRCLLLSVLSLVGATGCGWDPLVAPVASTISATAETILLQPGETTEVTAVVVEEAGTPVHDGTVVRFSATLGRMDPETAKTEDGVARSTFRAGNVLGTARVVVTSGAAISGEQPNVVDIEIDTVG